MPGRHRFFMDVIHYPDDARPMRWHQSVLALGNFDGLHRGHMTIVERVVRTAAERVVTPLVLTFDPHPTHFTVAQALDVVARLRPSRALLTHIAHDLGHAETSARLPPGVELAYDGLTVDIE